MKKLLPFIVLAFSISAFAQNNSSFVKKLKQQTERLQHRQETLGKHQSNNTVLSSGGQQTQAFIAIYDSVYEWSWDTIALSWKTYGKYGNFVYDAHHNMTNYIYKKWTGSIWVNSEQYFFTFDASNNQTSFLYQTWSGSAWVNYYQFSYTFDANNNQLSELDQSWSGSAWVNSYQNFQTYNTQNRRLTYLSQNWNTGSSSWVNANYSTDTYNANNLRIGEIGQNWNSGTGSWDNSYQNTYVYDANNNQINNFGQSWNSGASTWDNGSKGTSTYDANNNKLTQLSQSWSGSAYTNSSEDYYAYDGSNNQIVDIYQIWNGSAWVDNSYNQSNFDANNNITWQVYQGLNSAGTKITYGDSLQYYFAFGCIPLTPKICTISTDSASNYAYNNIYWNKAGYNHVDSFIVYRYDVSTASYLRIGATSKHALSVFKDTSANIGGPNGGSPLYAAWKYKIAIRDTCGNISPKSPYHQSMFVQESGSAFSWTPYIDSGYVNLPTGYSFLRDDNNTGSWHVLANVSSTSATDPNYASFPLANWRIDAIGFSCNPTAKYGAGNNGTQAAIVKSKSNISNNRGGFGVNQISTGANQINIYPNPSNGSFVIQTNTPAKQTMQVIDVTGKIVLSQTISGTSTIDASALNVGVYYITITGSRDVVNKKLVIVK